MGLVLTAAGTGSYMTVKEIHEMISYKCSYGAVRVSLRWLEKDQMIERKPDGRVTRIVPTQRGYDWFRPKLT